MRQKKITKKKYKKSKVNSDEFTLSLPSLTRVNSVKLIKLSDFTKNRVYLRVNTFLPPKNVNSSVYELTLNLWNSNLNQHIKSLGCIFSWSHTKIKVHIFLTVILIFF